MKIKTSIILIMEALLWHFFNSAETYTVVLSWIVIPLVSLVSYVFLRTYSGFWQNLAPNKAPIPEGNLVPPANSVEAFQGEPSLPTPESSLDGDGKSPEEGMGAEEILEELTSGAKEKEASKSPTQSSKESVAEGASELLDAMESLDGPSQDKNKATQAEVAPEEQKSVESGLLTQDDIDSFLEPTGDTKEPEAGENPKKEKEDDSGQLSQDDIDALLGQ